MICSSNEYDDLDVMFYVLYFLDICFIQIVVEYLLLSKSPALTSTSV